MSQNFEYENFEEYYKYLQGKFHGVFDKSDQKIVIDEVFGVIDEVSKVFDSSDLMSLTAYRMKLSVLKAYLGEHMSHMNFKTNTAYVFKKLSKAHKRKNAHERLHHLQMKTTQDAIDAELVKMTEEEEMEWIVNQYYTDKCKSLYDSIDWILSSISRRLEVLTDEKNESRSSGGGT